MALDKLVDSSQLDADLTTVANAIRTKGGTSAQLSFPSGMAQAIAAIPTGGEPKGFDKIKTISLVDHIVDSLTETFTLDIPPSVTSLENLFSGSYGSKNRDCDVVLNAPLGCSVTNLYRCFRYSLATRTQRAITINFSTHNVTNWSQMFDRSGLSGSPGRIIINGTPLDFSSATNVSGMFGNFIYNENYKSDFRLAPNTLSISWDIGTINITDETLQSIINGLAPSTTSPVLKFNQGVYNRLTETQKSAIAAKGWTVGSI